MTNIVVNANGTIKGVDAAGAATPGVATLGGMIYQLAVLGVRGQADSALNPQRLDYLSVAEDREEKIQGVANNNGGVCTISFTPPCQTISLPFAQPTQITVPDYLTAPSIGYTIGSGGTPTFTSVAWTTALADAIRLMNFLQLKLDKNPLSLALVESWQLASARPGSTATLDAELQATVKIPLQAFSDGLGGWRYAGLSPLGNLT
ncbi:MULTISPECIES: hypothetical protein [unclassified Microcoleus]|uniref:hypothetical protein n=1 Tax=unclassified Microcoleus TaxID=2642155 RepID=UPI0025F49AFA|nr:MULTISPECIES: hypothetical protein [unclassified Microcoleus]